MLLLEVGDQPVHLVENRSLLFLHQRGAHGLKLGLQGFELGVELIAVGAGHFGILTMAFAGVISDGAEMLVGNLCVNGEPSRFDTMPSRPILQAWRKTNSPSWESGRLA